MTYLLASGLVGAVVAIGAALAAIAYFGKRAVDKADDRAVMALDLSELRRANDEFSRTVADLEAGLRDARADVAAERSARKKVEEQRDRATTKLAEMGDPGGIAHSIRHDLDRLRALTEDSEKD